MPSLQLDITADLTALQKQALAREMGEEYSKIMNSDPRLMTVVIRALPLGSIWHCQEWEPVPGTLLICDVRAGRDRQTRDRLAHRLADLIAVRAFVSRMDIKVGFSQHSGEELFHPFLGGFNRDLDYRGAEAPITELSSEFQPVTGLE